MRGRSDVTSEISPSDIASYEVYDSDEELNKVNTKTFAEDLQINKILQKSNTLEQDEDYDIDLVSRKFSPRPFIKSEKANNESLQESNISKQEIDSPKTIAESEADENGALVRSSLRNDNLEQDETTTVTIEMTNTTTLKPDIETTTNLGRGVVNIGNVDTLNKE